MVGGPGALRYPCFFPEIPLIFCRPARSMYFFDEYSLDTDRRELRRGSELVRVEGGKIAEEHLYYDQVQVLTQLGLIPAPAAPAATA